jgi:hypothetical protein
LSNLNSWQAVVDVVLDELLAFIGEVYGKGAEGRKAANMLNGLVELGLLKRASRRLEQLADEEKPEADS